MISDKLANQLVKEKCEVYLYSILTQDEGFSHSEADSYIKSIQNKIIKKRKCDICGLKEYHEYDKEGGILTTLFNGYIVCPKCYEIRRK